MSEPVSAEPFQSETDLSPIMIQSTSSLDLVRVNHQTIESDIEGNRVLDEKPPKDNFQIDFNSHAAKKLTLHVSSWLKPTIEIKSGEPSRN